MLTFFNASMFASQLVCVCWENMHCTNIAFRFLIIIKIMIRNNFLAIKMIHYSFLGHQSYVLLFTETNVSNPPVVFPKSSCNILLFRDSWLEYLGYITLPVNTIVDHISQSIVRPINSTRDQFVHSSIGSIICISCKKQKM